MSAYGCVATGRDEGMIEIVRNSMTLSKIQKDSKGSSRGGVFDKRSLYEWLEQQNPDPKQYGSSFRGVIWYDA